MSSCSESSVPKGEQGAAVLRVFDVGINDKVSIKLAFAMGVQNVFTMVGIFVFPGIMGLSFQLPEPMIAYLYGATFIGCGVTTLLMSMFFGRMPLATGSYAGIFAALLILGHLSNAGLGAAFGSLCVASLLWCLLSIPIRGVSVVLLIATVVRAPLISGSIIMLVMMQIADLTLPHWLGKPGESTFPLVNFGVGLVTALVLMILTVSKRPMVRRLSLIISLFAGTALFEAFKRIDFTAVVQSSWFVAPKLFPFGVSFNLGFCLVLFIILIAINIQTMTLMNVVGEWGHEDMPPARLAKGVFSMMLGSAIASAIGGYSCMPYPANVGLLRSTGVASRYVTFATSLILIFMGLCIKIDHIFVLIPVPVLAAGGTVLFGIVFVHGVELLAKVEWNNRSLTITGFSLMTGFGTLFLDHSTLAGMPFFANLMLRQPIIVGVFSLIVLDAILPGRSERKPAKGGVALSAKQPT